MKGKVAWLVPAPLRGSGGHRTIFQNVTALAAAGCECHVFLEAPGPAAEYDSPLTAKELVERWFGPVPATFHLGYELDRDFDVAFATAWFTAEPLKWAERARSKAYFIQDYEAYFMPMSDGFIQAENTFRYQFHGTTIGRWLTARLGRDFDMACSPFDFCADRSVYRPLAHIERELAVCFVYQPEKPRRCSIVGGQALAIVKHEMPEVKIYFYGNDQPAHLDYEVRHLGLIPIESCNELYNRSTVGLCISATNPSRVPFEMMAAGLPVVDIHRENNLYDMPEDAVLLAEPTPESIASALLEILRNPTAQRARGRAGIDFMRDRDLQHGFDQFTAFTERLIDGPTAVSEPIVPTKLYKRPPATAPRHLLPRYATVLRGAHHEDAKNDPIARASAFVTRAQRKLEQTLRRLYSR
ncbi:hypothetical protein BH09MYX1_BH09MYX1_25760 [soil metagenome]